MTFPRLAPRDRRVLAGGAVALTVLIGLPRGGHAWLGWRAGAMQAAAEMTHELEKTRVMIAGIDTALDSAEVRVARFRELGTLLFVVRTPGEVATGLRAAVHAAAGASSVRILGLESRLDTARVGTLRRVAATVQANGDVAGLAALLQLLETHKPILAVRTLSVQPQSVETPQHAQEVLDIRFTVEALALITGQRNEP